MNFLALLLIASAMSTPPVRVRGHVTKQGRVVQPHVRTSPDHRKSNNWSSKGLVNPYTGKKGNK